MKRNKRYAQRPPKDNANRSSKRAPKDSDSTPEMRDKLSSLNDLSWYTRYPQLVETASRFPYTIKPGSNFNLGSYEDGSTSTVSPIVPKSATLNMPGVLVLDWMPSVGTSNLSTDPASIVARELYSRVRSKFSSSLDVDPPDFLMYIMALDSVYSYIGSLKRIYRLLMAYTPENYNLPELVLAGLGIPLAAATNLLANKADFLQSINELCYMVRRFTCPASMDIFNRHYWMNDNVYTDAPTIGAQMYVFHQSHFFQYAAQNTPDKVPASGLTLLPAPVVADSPQDAVNVLFQFGRDLIETLSAWDDAYTINGYLMRAFEGANLFTVDILSADEAFAPVYVEEVLMQIENSKTLAYPLAKVPVFTVSQDPKTNTVLCNPKITIAEDTFLGSADLNPWLTMRSPAPTWQENVIATRLTAYVEQDAVGTTYNIVAGTEIPVVWNLWRYSDNWEVNDHIINNAPVYQTTQINLESSGSQRQFYQSFLNLFKLTAFDWHPQVFVNMWGGTNYGLRAIVGDTHYITVCNKDALKNLHRICTYSEFNAFTE